MINDPCAPTTQAEAMGALHGYPPIKTNADFYRAVVAAMRGDTDAKAAIDDYADRQERAIAAFRELTGESDDADF